MLEKLILKYRTKKNEIETWLKSHRDIVNGPIYNSVDLRNAGFKLTAIDTNIFPGGFNNLCPNYSKKTSKLLKEYLKKHYPKAKKILIFPESHTKNTFYLENVRKLQIIVEKAGFEVIVGHINNELPNFAKLKTAANETLYINKISKSEQIIYTHINKDKNTKTQVQTTIKNKLSKFIPDIILTNNDFAGDISEILHDLSIPILPNPELGWHKRSKFNNSVYYNKLIQEFAKILDIDPWFFTPETIKITDVNFQDKQGFQQLIQTAETMLKTITQKYKKYNIQQKPYLFIKNDSGTYGIAVHPIESIEEIKNMNRKTRNKLSIGKDKKNVHTIILQEGVPTIEKFKNITGEPVIYLVGNKAAGGFFRLNEAKNEKGNLNAKGMKFLKMCFEQILGYENSYPECNLECLEEIYYTIAEIASIASGYEMKDIEQ